MELNPASRPLQVDEKHSDRHSSGDLGVRVVNDTFYIHPETYQSLKRVRILQPGSESATSLHAMCVTFPSSFNMAFKDWGVEDTRMAGEKLLSLIDVYDPIVRQHMESPPPVRGYGARL